ncbi:MAG: threonine/serine dehydratase [Candidatus Heimdallarchaeota archaeon]|nr:threonine/serine dehydratase [Candidatus Heimdallarchaeota archaeon]
MMDFVKEAEKAEKRIRTYIRRTPLEFSHFLSKEGDTKVFLKLENLQLTNSFKIRGAINKVLSLEKNEKERGVITSSSGNHGAAFAFITSKLGIEGTIFLPEYTSQAKRTALQNYGTKLEFIGNDCVHTENHARKIAIERGLPYISPYNDPQIVAGQATIGIELMEQLKDIDVVLVPVGGGGLISGIAGYLKSIDKNIKIIGCQPINSAVMYESIKAGKIIVKESLDTISDGTAGGIEEHSITYDYCKKYIDDFILVSEEEIKESIKLIMKHHYMLIEGAAALTVSSFLKSKDDFAGKNVVLIISGAKISLDKIKEIMC